MECAIRYAGEFFDAETGLYYLRARYYAPYIGRFISEDSYWGEDNNPLSLNRYTYTHNDPIQYLDPTGYAVIKKGSQGDGVVAIQEMLKDLGYNTGKVDGKYGSNTEAAIKKFQKDNGLKADGIVGNQSLTALKTMTSVKNAPESEKAWAKESISSIKTGGIKDDTILMSKSSLNNAYKNITTVKDATGGGSVQTQIKNNTIVITGATVKKENSKGAEVKVTPAKEISATLNKSVAVFSATVSNEAKTQEKSGSNTGSKTTSSKSVAPAPAPTPSSNNNRNSKTNSKKSNSDNNLYGVDGNTAYLGMVIIAEDDEGILQYDAKVYGATASYDGKFVYGSENNWNGTKQKGGGYKQNYGIDMRAETGVAVGSVNAGGQVGNNNIGVVGEVGGALGSANAYAGFSARAGQETSIGFRVGAEASALELGASGGVNIFGYTIQVGVEGAVFDASAVAEFGVSNMQIKGRARLGLGLGAGFWFNISQIE